MEPNTPQNSDTFFELNIDHDSGNHFKETSKWTSFISVVYFVLMALIILSLTLAGGIMMDQLNNLFVGMASAGGIIIIVVAVFIIVFFAVTFLLYRFGTLTRAGIERQDQHLFTKGMQALKNYFMLYGILTVLAVLVSIVASIKTIANF